MSSKNLKNTKFYGLALALAIASACLLSQNVFANGDCNFLSQKYCSSDGMGVLFGDVLNVLKGAVYFAGGIGVIICGIVWATALDNEGRVGWAKRRLSEIAIGIVVFALFDVITGILGIG